MRWRSKESGRSVQSNHSHKYDNDGHHVAPAAVRSKVPPRKLREDETAFYPLDEDAYDVWSEYRGLIQR